MSSTENQISVVNVVNSTDEEFEAIAARVDAMTEDEAAELLKLLISEISRMQKDTDG